MARIIVKKELCYFVIIQECYLLVVKSFPEHLKQSFALLKLLRLSYISSLIIICLSWEGVNHFTKQPVLTQSAPRRWLNTL